VEEATAGGACSNTYSDVVDAVEYSGSDGSLAWPSDWLEVAESDGPTLGDERVIDLSGNHVLQVKDKDGGGEGLEREADLSSSPSATLDFEYRRNKFDDAGDFVTIDVSKDGGATWAPLGSIGGVGSDLTFQAASYSLDGNLAPNTRIRFLTSPDLNDKDQFWIDNVEICLH
jgi:hypothetical protein